MLPAPQAPRIIRLGLVGAGEVAQVCHLPALKNLAHLFKVTAICDISEQSLAYCSGRYGPFKTYTASKDLCADPEVDAVLVVNSDEYHASVAIEAATANKHVFIEKPMALTRPECQSIIDAVKANNVKCFIGYMRRYSPAFEQAVELVGGLENICHARVRDIIGKNEFFVAQSGAFPKRFTDFPAGAFEEKMRLADVISETAIGELSAHPVLKRMWRLLGGLGSHDLSTMREALGVPKSCVGATASMNNSVFLNALFEYENFTVSYETGIDSVKRFDASLEIFGVDKVVKVTWDSPYVTGLPTKLVVQGTDAHGQFYETTTRASYVDPYIIEMERFHEALIGEKPIKTTPEDALLDLGIFEMVIHRLAESVKPVKAANGVNGHSKA